MENYASAVWVQIALELAGCLLLADFARRIAPAALSAGAAHGTLWLAALCPFTAIYAVQAAHRVADALCDRSGAVVGGALPRTAGMGAGALLYLCGHLCGAAPAGRRAGGSGAGAGAGDRAAE